MKYEFRGIQVFDICLMTTIEIKFLCIVKTVFIQVISNAVTTIYEMWYLEKKTNNYAYVNPSPEEFLCMIMKYEIRKILVYDYFCQKKV